MLQLQIADNGIGVPEQVRETMFEPMMESSGIGLDKVKAVIDAHHGTIRMATILVAFHLLHHIT